ncbi:hypothetical protein BH11MYX3_BH11MYX3_18970 [soil metagenome]
MTLVETIALSVVGAGVFAGVITAWSARSVRTGTTSMLELWTAAGLLKLGAEASWQTIAIAAAVVAIRKLVTLRPDGEPDGTRST